jgi:hypothetical protein
MLGSQLDIYHAFRLLALDPLDALKLGIDEQRVSAARYDDSSVLDRDSVCREAFSSPHGLLGGC